MHALNSGSLSLDSEKLSLSENVPLLSGNRLPSSNFLFLRAIMRQFQHKTSLRTRLFPKEREKAFASSADESDIIILYKSEVHCSNDVIFIEL